MPSSTNFNPVSVCSDSVIRLDQFHLKKKKSRLNSTLSPFLVPSKRCSIRRGNGGASERKRLSLKLLTINSEGYSSGQWKLSFIRLGFFRKGFQITEIWTQLAIFGDGCAFNSRPIFGNKFGNYMLHQHFTECFGCIQW